MPLYAADSESETGSRVSVTPLASLKNSPRSSPEPPPLSDRVYLNSLKPQPKEPTIIFPKVEPVSNTMSRFVKEEVGKRWRSGEQ